MCCFGPGDDDIETGDVAVPFGRAGEAVMPEVDSAELANNDVAVDACFRVGNRVDEAHGGDRHTEAS